MKLPLESESDVGDLGRTPAAREGLAQTTGTSAHNSRCVDYSEYEWMGEEMEEFDRQCIEQLLEDEFIEDCFEEMLEEEEEVYDLVDWFCEQYGDDVEPQVVMDCLQSLALDNNIELTFLQDPTAVTKRRADSPTTALNPHAPEFIPRSASVQVSSPLSSPDLTPFDR